MLVHLLWMHCTVTLVSKNLPKVRALIHKACPQWYDLGLELGVEETTLDVIKNDNDNKTEICFRAMLSVWLKMIDPCPSWEGLVAALKQPYIGHEELADKVNKEQGIAPKATETVEPPETISKLGELSIPQSYGSSHLWFLCAAQKQQSPDVVITLCEASALVESSKHITNRDGH